MAYDNYNYENATSAEIKAIEKTARFPDYDNKKSYASKSIGTIYITGGGFIKRPFTGAGVDSRYGWEQLAWKSPPNRGGDFSFSNMDDIDVGLVARCELNIKYMNYQDYIDLRSIIARQRHFLVEFYNTDTNDWIEREMYCSEDQIGKFFSLKSSMIGVLDFSIKFVGTNNDQNHSNLKIAYFTDDNSEFQSKLIKWGGQVSLELAILSKPGYILSGWLALDSNNNVCGEYRLGQSITVWTDINLHPKWVAE